MHMVRREDSLSSESKVIHSDIQQRMIKVTFAFSLLRLLVHSREVYGFKFNKQPFGLTPTTPADVQYKWLKTYPFTQCKLKSAIKLRAVDGHSHFRINISSWFEIWSRAVKATPSEARTEIDLDWQLDLQGYAQTSCSKPNRTLIRQKYTPKTWRGKQKKKLNAQN